MVRPTGTRRRGSPAKTPPATREEPRRWYATRMRDADKRLLHETGVAALLMLTIAVAVTLLYRAVTGLSPWPYLAIAMIGAAGWGTVMLALCSPARRG